MCAAYHCAESPYNVTETRVTAVGDRSFMSLWARHTGVAACLQHVICVLLCYRVSYCRIASRRALRARLESSHLAGSKYRCTRQRKRALCENEIAVCCIERGRQEVAGDRFRARNLAWSASYCCRERIPNHASVLFPNYESVFGVDLYVFRRAGSINEIGFPLSARFLESTLGVHQP